ncbi:MAG: pilus assembly protein [Pseudomonadota bacterium]
MISSCINHLRRFRRDEDGSSILIEFMLFVPIIFSTFLMATEMGIYQMRQMQLDRGLDVAVREVRLNTSTQYTHDQFKDMICANTGWLEDCSTNIKLEMNTVNPRNFAAFDTTPDCLDTSDGDPQPPRGFTHGLQNDMMMLRACIRFRPVFPTSGLGRTFTTDGAGLARMTSTAAFVQEPN